MMRKDVKIGFAIGGILVAVLIVYVLAVSGGKKHDGVQLAEGPTPTPATPGAVTDRPTEATDPFKQPAGDSPSKHVDAASAPPSIPPEKSEPRGTEEDKWMLALSRGTVPMMTT